ncbi:hypothetical protein Asp14428_08570 [Actinoplanes sp. NBRC 14428]|uniref:Uncharacterized protein n=1 Tax=Pseudosporangium ferrugineum TaxID=439699 RepID=A0A2T0SG33_9ACTN|nr:hypothetical protein [Pseudosporangium ferrugineum]PRY32369.1 hypothetical protein CLV70_102580 [Pseudosporangium ferrugineum]BCJ49382.1 hypothetical protein Asp14428_08570 [Actinoplanes sp. NBRC 14428]
METSHEMILARRGAAGTEEWACRECGRRLMLRWEPEFERLVLEPGDERVAHAGAQGISVGGRAGEVPAGGTPFAEHDRHWLRAHGIEADGSAA